jgi:hypothetical protein
MSRSERYIPPSDEQWERIRQAQKAAEQFDRQRVDLLRAALKRTRKADLVEITLRIAQGEKASQWTLEDELNLDKPIDLLVHDIDVAIGIATRIDELRLNYNFDYDWEAYETVERGLSQLIQKNRLDEIKKLALKLMDKGSYQIECTDEGQMQENIESCLRPVIAAVRDTNDGRDWAMEMLQRDRMGFVCEAELRELAGLTQKRW